MVEMSINCLIKDLTFNDLIEKESSTCNKKK